MSPSEAPAQPPQEGVWRIRTQSGSLYVVARDATGLWLFSGRNVPNPRSVSLAAGIWPIEPPQPWPPVPGQPLVLAALGILPFGHPLRVPGGGKLTSPVVDVEEVALAAPLDEVLALMQRWPHSGEVC